MNADQLAPFLYRLRWKVWKFDTHLRWTCERFAVDDVVNVDVEGEMRQISSLLTLVRAMAILRCVESEKLYEITMRNGGVRGAGAAVVVVDDEGRRGR